MRHFLFEDKEYRYRPNFKFRRNKIKDPAVELIRLLRIGGKGSRPGPRPRDLRQKCTVKMQYSKNIGAHLFQINNYLVKEGRGLNGGTPELFGTDSEEYRRNMVPLNFRVFLSPKSGDIDLKLLTEKFVQKLEKQTGHHIYYQAACHYNTAHAHAHLLINGIDKKGREVWIPRDIVKTFMRESAMNLCTEQIGRRTQADLDMEKEQELYVPRKTKLDSRIEELCVGRRISFGGAVHDKERILIRLETLRKLKLCTYENGGYVFKQGWKNDLEANSRYNVFLKAREELKFTDPSLMKVYSGSDGLITGKVTKIYKTDDDASDNHVVVLEGIDGKAYFVPLLKKPEVCDRKNIGADPKTGEAKHETFKAPLNEGELITLKTYTSQKGRLTPILFKANIKLVQKEIKLNSYSRKLASEVKETKTNLFDSFKAKQQANAN
jgi:hypothetical protein